MTLSFSQTWDKEMGDLAGKPTEFLDKIWYGLFESGMDKSLLAEYSKNYNDKFGEDWDSAGHLFMPKYTTIRYDPHNRWKVGTKIHMVINSRTKNRFQFAPVLECKSTQEIRLKWTNVDIEHTEDGEVSLDYEPFVTIDTKPFYNNFYGIDGGMERLAQNDGFPSVESFFRYFNQDMRGGWKIISWIDNIKY